MNIKFFHPDELDDLRLVLVLSAGPNETIQTPFTLSPGEAPPPPIQGTASIQTVRDQLDPAGDDIAERLR